MIRVGFFIDLAVAVADGATTISDIAVLGDQVELCGPVASDSTCWRLLDGLDSTALDHIAQARAGAREVVWAQRAQPLDKPFSSATAAGREIPGLGCTRQFVRGHEKVPTGGQVPVPVVGQLKVPVFACRVQGEWPCAVTVAGANPCQRTTQGASF